MSLKNRFLYEEEQKETFKPIIYLEYTAHVKHCFLKAALVDALRLSFIITGESIFHVCGRKTLVSWDQTYSSSCVTV